jgi:hypothetical protein
MSKKTSKTKSLEKFRQNAKRIEVEFCELVSFLAFLGVASTKRIFEKKSIFNQRKK